MATVSPYHGIPVADWPSVTDKLVAAHPLSPTIIARVAQKAWQSVWSTQIGSLETHIPLRDVAPPATVIGYFFEKLFARELEIEFPGQWRGGATGTEKDLHCISDPRYSVEMKSSGQLGLRIFGNRSYGQALTGPATGKKDKSGYYITVNFHGECLNLLRFGWIDSTDWKPQNSPTGQMAGLPEDVYRYKLMPICGSYVLDAPLQILPGIGASIAEIAYADGIRTIRDVLGASDTSKPYFRRLSPAARAYAALYSGSANNDNS